MKNATNDMDVTYKCLTVAARLNYSTDALLAAVYITDADIFPSPILALALSSCTLQPSSSEDISNSFPNCYKIISSSAFA